LLLANEGSTRTGKMARGLLEVSAIAEPLSQPPGSTSSAATLNGSFARTSSLGPVARG
jgi:hypothetical protein